jgi:hypothetical protein
MVAETIFAVCVIHRRILEHAAAATEHNMPPVAASGIVSSSETHSFSTQSINHNFSSGTCEIHSLITF